MGNNHVVAIFTFLTLINLQANPEITCKQYFNDQLNRFYLIRSIQMDISDFDKTIDKAFMLASELKLEQLTQLTQDAKELYSQIKSLLQVKNFRSINNATRLEIHFKYQDKIKDTVSKIKKLQLQLEQIEDLKSNSSYMQELLVEGKYRSYVDRLNDIRSKISANKKLSLQQKDIQDLILTPLHVSGEKLKKILNSLDELQNFFLKYEILQQEVAYRLTPSIAEFNSALLNEQEFSTATSSGNVGRSISSGEYVILESTFGYNLIKTQSEVLGLIDNPKPKIRSTFALLDPEIIVEGIRRGDFFIDQYGSEYGLVGFFADGTALLQIIKSSYPVYSPDGFYKKVKVSDLISRKKGRFFPSYSKSSTYTYYTRPLLAGDKVATLEKAFIFDPKIHKNLKREDVALLDWNTADFGLELHPSKTYIDILGVTEEVSPHNYTYTFHGGFLGSPAKEENRSKIRHTPAYVTLVGIFPNNDFLIRIQSVLSASEYGNHRLLRVRYEQILELTKKMIWEDLSYNTWVADNLYGVKPNKTYLSTHLGYNSNQPFISLNFTQIQVLILGNNFVLYMQKRLKAETGGIKFIGEDKVQQSNEKFPDTTQINFFVVSRQEFESIAREHSITVNNFNYGSPLEYQGTYPLHQLLINPR